MIVKLGKATPIALTNMSQVEMVGTESEKCADTVSDRLLTPQPVDGRPAEISTFRRLLPQVSARFVEGAPNRCKQKSNCRFHYRKCKSFKLLSFPRLNFSLVFVIMGTVFDVLEFWSGLGIAINRRAGCYSIEPK